MRPDSTGTVSVPRDLWLRIERAITVGAYDPMRREPHPYGSIILYEYSLACADLLADIKAAGVRS